MIMKENKKTRRKRSLQKCESKQTVGLYGRNFVACPCCGSLIPCGAPCWCKIDWLNRQFIAGYFTIYSYTGQKKGKNR